MLSLIPADGSEAEDLKRRLLAGRYSEFRMRFFLGKDVSRWIDQRIEWAGNQPALADADGLRPQSFAGLLTASPPEPVKSEAAGVGRGGPFGHLRTRDRYQCRIH